ncbi:hypothetical protein DKX38_027302 [Salix brachista]|uniref:GAG-pre-integrase domain-containing protein n=1 Tax=Salix brachista TaxID=2182728 RepID=A0A5N5JFA3_9ROSI|nr:hypothetical protein DKX38_027302 [Salix brachista]
MASSSTDASVPFIFPNINHLISVKLDGSNYLGWVSQFLPVLRSNDLLSIVDGSETCPSKFLVDTNGQPTSKLDPNFVLWTKKDQYILSWLNATLSESILPTVFGLNTSKEVWDLLANRFAAQNRSRITHLKRQLQNLQQGNKSCSDYVQAAKSYANQLAAVGKSIDDDDLISYIIGGLNNEYTSFITSFSFATRDHPLSFYDFQSELLSYETLLENQVKAVPPEAGQFALFNQYRGSTGYNKKQRYGQPRNSPRMPQSSYPHRPQHASRNGNNASMVSGKFPRNSPEFPRNSTTFPSPVAFLGVKASATIWHNRLGHPSTTVFKQVLSNFSLPVTNSQLPTSLCEPSKDISSATPPQQNSSPPASQTRITGTFLSNPLISSVPASTSRNCNVQSSASATSATPSNSADHDQSIPSSSSHQNFISPTDEVLPFQDQSTLPSPITPVPEQPLPPIIDQPAQRDNSHKYNLSRNVVQAYPASNAPEDNIVSLFSDDNVNACSIM